MNARKSKSQAQDQETIPQIPHTDSGNIGQDFHHSHFVLTTIVSLERSVSQVTTSLVALEKSLDGVKSKVEELVSWKHKIIGGFIALTMVAFAVGFLTGKLFDYAAQKAAEASVAQPVAAVPQKSTVQKPPVKQTPIGNSQ